MTDTPMTPASQDGRLWRLSDGTIVNTREIAAQILKEVRNAK